MVTETFAAIAVGESSLLKKRFFTLSSVSELTAFDSDLNHEDPFSAALSFLIRSWLPLLPADGLAKFEPRLFMTDDLSAAMLGTCPVIFMGSNAWATKPYLDVEVHLKKAEMYSRRLANLREIFAGKKVAVVVVPEKDYVIDRQFLATGRFNNIDAAIALLSSSCKSVDFSFVFDDYMVPLKKFDSIADFEYFDTHLPAKYYIQIFAKLLKDLDLSWQDFSSDFTLVDDQSYGDLSTKFSARTPVWKYERVVSSKRVAVSVVEGSPSFAEPLGSTWQKIANSHPFIAGKVLVLGDSHSSILAQHRLTYLLASTVKECEFIWNPFGVRAMPEPTDADFVVLEISQRFLF